VEIVVTRIFMGWIPLLCVRSDILRPTKIQGLL
jgi:hypothetical protein